MGRNQIFDFRHARRKFNPHGTSIKQNPACNAGIVFLTLGLPEGNSLRTGPRKIPFLLKASREFLFLGAHAFSLENITN